MLRFPAVEKVPDLGSRRASLIGTLAVLALAANCAAAPGFTLTNCILPPTSRIGVQAVVGQPAYDPITQFVYLPDMSTASKGIWRYSFNGTIFTSLSGVSIAPTLAALRPAAVALGPDGNLYATMAANTSIQRVNTPAGLTQTVDILGITTGKTPAHGLAFEGSKLWIADTGNKAAGSVLLIAGATTCVIPCKGTSLFNQPGLAVLNPTSVTFDAVRSLMYIGTSSGVFQNNLLTGQTVLYSKFFVNGVVSGLLTDVTAVGVDNVGNLFYVNDPTVSQTVGAATAYSVPANSVPDGQGNVVSPPPTIPPTVSAAPAFANPALLVSTGLSAPKGAVFMGTHVWVVDSLRGFCKVVPTLPAPSLTACAVLPLGFVPG